MSDQENNANERPSADDIFSMAPADPEKIDRQPAIYPPATDPLPEEPPESLDRSRRQFTLAELLILTTVSSMFMSLVVVFARRWDWAAGLAGLLAFLSLIVLLAFEPDNRAVRLGWWTMLVFYLLACLGAIMSSLITGK